MSKHFGEHLMIDGYLGDFGALDSRDLVYKSLNELPAKLRMKKLSDPVVYAAPGNDKKDPGGWSGFVVIEESHISVHTFPKRGFVSIDVYTCQNELDTKIAIEHFRTIFNLQDIETNFILRGTRYPEENII